MSFEGTDVVSEKRMLSLEEVEAETGLELPDRELLAAIEIGSISVNVAVAANVCPAIAVLAVAAQTPACAVIVAQG